MISLLLVNHFFKRKGKRRIYCIGHSLWPAQRVKMFESSIPVSGSPVLGIHVKVSFSFARGAFAETFETISLGRESVPESAILSEMLKKGARIPATKGSNLFCEVLDPISTRSISYQRRSPSSWPLCASPERGARASVHSKKRSKRKGR